VAEFKCLSIGIESQRADLRQAFLALAQQIVF
jgi:hypothetical protein